MSSPCASTQASASCPAVTSFSAAISSTRLDQLQVALEVLALEARAVAAEVVLGQVLARAEAAGEEAAAERAVGDEADPQLAQGRQDLVLGIAAPERVLGLQRRDRMGRVGAADRLRRRLGEAEVAHLALLDQLGHRADRLLDRHLGIDPVLVVEVDVSTPSRCSEASQHSRT